MMTDLVVMQNGEAVTSSLKVAEIFGKEHGHVLRDIENLTLQNWTVKELFKKGTYFNSRNREYPLYYMGRDAFSLLAMGFTGEKALEFKLNILNEFNRMESYIREVNHTGLTMQVPDELKQHNTFLQLSQQAQMLNMITQNWIDSQVRMNQIESRTEKLEQTTHEIKELQDYKVAINSIQELNLEIKKLSRLYGETEQWVRNVLYDRVNKKSGKSIHQKAKVMRDKIQEARVNSGKKPYAESTLTGKYPFYQAIVDLGLIEELTDAVYLLQVNHKKNLKKKGL